MKQLDYKLLEEKLINLKPRTKLYKLLKKHLLSLGWWKNKSRGKPRNFYA